MDTLARAPKPFTAAQLAQAIDNTPELPSLRSINDALAQLIRAENSIGSQIAEIIRRDPSLTSRLLKIVNSVFFSLNQKVSNIEEAVLYLGLRQIREFALATPVIEDMGTLSGVLSAQDWKEVWKHSIATAIITREVLSIANVPYDDDTDYIMGLVHNIGKIVMASAFPDATKAILNYEANSPQEIAAFEKELIGWDHAMIGSYYLKRHTMSDEIIEATQFHNHPEDAQLFPKSAAAVQIADALARSINICGIEKVPPPEKQDWVQLSGWKILFGENAAEYPLILASMRYALMRIPSVIEGAI
jgi:HD-like signal output (HDOD) protein